jgi:hypothetical protein
MDNILSKRTAIVLVIMLMAIEVSGDVRTWNCGDSGDYVIATLKDAKTLVVSGTGKMASYDPYSYRDKSFAPWYNIRGNITKVIIEHGVTNIGAYTFDGFTRLTSVTIPNSMKEIYRGAFYSCSTLTSVTIPKSVTDLGDVAFAATSLKSVVIPDGIYYINSAFANCKNLTSVKFGNRLRFIGEFAFIGCTSLTAIELPKSVVEIEYFAFIGCTNLMSITVQNPKPPQEIKGWAFGTTMDPNEKDDVYFSRACLYVPKNSIAAYRIAGGWNRFKCIKPIESAPEGGK